MAGVTALAGIWGGNFILVERALLEFDPAFIVLWRALLASACLLLLLRGVRSSHRLNLKSWPWVFLAAAIGQLIPWFLFAWGQQGVSGSFAGIYTALTPLAVVPLSFILLKIRPLPREVLGAILGFFGVTAFFASGIQLQGESWPYHLACLVGSIAYAAAFPVTAYILREFSASKLTLAFYQSVMTSLVLVPFGASQSAGDATQSVSLIPILALTLLGMGSAVTYWLNFWVVKEAGPIAASTSFYLIPVVAVTIGVLFDSDKVPVSSWWCLSLIAVGVILVFSSERTKGYKEAPDRGCGQADQIPPRSIG